MNQLDLKTAVDKMLHRRPAVGLAVGVVRNGALESFHAHGVADIASNTPITQDTVFRIASITKTFTAIAVMQLWEQGLIDLDTPADDHLSAYRLTPARPGHRAATPRHLLTHTAGVPQMVHPTQALRSGWFGESVETGQPLPTLAEHYRGRLRLATEPGTTFTYTDHGFATLGQIVEDISGQPLERYLRQHVFEPLGMTNTSLVRSDRITSHLATGYRLTAKGPQPLTDREWITTAAASAYSTPRDMARYLAALTGGGANEHGSVLKPATLASMYEAGYQPDPRVPGIGLAFFRADLGGHAAVEHPGILPGFNTQIFVAPDDGAAVMAFTNGAANALMWLPTETGRLLGHVIGVPEATIRTGIPHHPEIWGDLVGWYRPRAQLTDLQTRSITGAGAEVVVRRGRLRLRVLSPVPALYTGFPLHPDDEQDPYTFRIDLSAFGLGTARVVFSREPGPRTIHLDLAPLTLHQQPAATNPRLWATGALTAATAVMAVRRRRHHRP
ncbi:MAG: beta-lactamase [Nonomuraea muscovyensis]|nr:beta-lactamase [Nonomuraea muscovyensis]